MADMGFGKRANMDVLTYSGTTAMANAEAIGSLFAGTPFEMGYSNTFFGIPIIMPAGGYCSTVVPVIVATYFAVKLEKWFKKVIPAAICQGRIYHFSSLFVTIHSQFALDTNLWF